VRFQATIEPAGKTATGIEVPVEVVEGLGSSRKPPVRVTIRQYTFRSTVASRRGRYLIGVSAQTRERAGVAAGDDVAVAVELDDKPREVAVPADLAFALERDARAGAFFDRLSYSQKRWYVLPIEQAKKPETRRRRVEKALTMLRERRKR
jgi:hypothetical protein